MGGRPCTRHAQPSVLSMKAGGASMGTSPRISGEMLACGASPKKKPILMDWLNEAEDDEARLPLVVPACRE
jgi:hypothetical protein